MIIKEMDLDSLCKDEYLAFIKTLIHYFYVQFDEEIKLVDILDKEQE